MRLLAARTSSIVTSELAPEATTMVFSPESSTVIMPRPLGVSGVV